MFRRRDEGLTLIELLVTIALVAVVASIAVPVLLNTVSKAQTTADTQSGTNISAFTAQYTAAGYTVAPGTGENTGYLVATDPATGLAVAKIKQGAPTGAVASASLVLIDISLPETNNSTITVGTNTKVVFTVAGQPMGPDTFNFVDTGRSFLGGFVQDGEGNWNYDPNAVNAINATGITETFGGVAYPGTLTTTTVAGSNWVFYTDNAGHMGYITIVVA